MAECPPDCLTCRREREDDEQYVEPGDEPGEFYGAEDDEVAAH